MQRAGENFVLPRDNMPKLKEQLQAAMKQMADFEKLKSHIAMTVTAEGLRIEFSQSARGTFFDSGSAKLNADGAELLVTLAQELAGLPNILKNSDNKLSADETAPENNRPAGESNPAAKQ